MTIAVPFPVEPMEAEPAGELPNGKGWLYEPKHDSFRSIALRDGYIVRSFP